MSTHDMLDNVAEWAADAIIRAPKMTDAEKVVIYEKALRAVADDHRKARYPSSMVCCEIAEKALLEVERASCESPTTPTIPSPQTGSASS